MSTSYGVRIWLFGREVTLAFASAEKMQAYVNMPCLHDFWIEVVTATPGDDK